MNTPLISIIIPAYNAEKTIEECIQSGIDQTYQHIEIIVVDNNSNDKTNKIIFEFQKCHSKVIRFLHESVQGVSFARNKGLSEARGEWIQFLDSDDIIYPDKLSRQIAIINANVNKSAMVVGAYNYVFTDKRIKKVPIFNSANDPYKSITSSHLGHVDSNLFHKSSLLAINGFDETLTVCEDTDLTFRMLLHFGPKSILYDHTPSAEYRSRQSGQLTKSDPILINKEGLKVRLSIDEKIKHNLPEYYSKNSDFYIDYIYYFIYRIGIYDILYAEQLHTELIAKDYKPKLSSQVISVLHVLSYRLLGFATMIRIRKWIKKMYMQIIKAIIFIIQIRK